MSDAIIHAGTAAQGKRYAAFISYSHADQEIGDWLHKRLENYLVPSSLIGRAGANGPIGKKLGKVFRDRVELSASPDLGAEIRMGLEQSDALIVLCSPRSCGSRYVAEEIVIFKRLGKGRRIFAAIIDGEPHAAGKPGRTAVDECFPPALIYQLDANGALTDRPEPLEPIAADFREDKDGRENGLLKLIAGILGVGLDDLVERERQAERRRRLRASAIAVAMGVLALGAIIAGGLAFWQEAQARNALGRVFVERSAQAIERGDYNLAARYALAGWRATPANEDEFRALLGRVLREAGESRALLGHEGEVTNASFSPDGERAVTSSIDGTARVWDVATRRQLFRLAHDGRVSFAEFDGNGSRIVSLAADCAGEAACSRYEVRVWDATDGQLLVSFSPQEGYTPSASFSPDGARILTFGAGVTEVWNAANGHRLFAVEGYSEAFNADVIVTSNRGAVCVWNAESGALSMELPGGDFALNGDTLVVVAREEDADPVGTCTHSIQGGVDRVVIRASRRGEREEASTGIILSTSALVETERASFPDTPSGELELSPNGQRLLARSDAEMRVYDMPSGHMLAQIQGLSSVVKSASFSPDGDRIVTASEDGVARVFETDSGRLIAGLSIHTDILNSAEFSHDGQSILTASQDGTARLWRSDGGEVAVFRSERNEFEEARFSPDEQRIAIADEAGFVDIIDVRTGRRLLHFLAGEPETRRDFIIDSDPIRSVRFRPDGAQIATASSKGLVRLWDSATGNMLHQVSGAGHTVEFSPDGARIVTTAQGDDEVVVWNAATGGVVSRFAMPNLPMLSHAQYSPDGLTLAVLCSGGVCLYDANTGRALRTLPIGSDAVPGRAVFSRDGSRMAVVESGLVRIFDVSGGDLLATLRAGDTVDRVAFNSDASRVATADEEGVVTLLDARTGRVLATLRAHDEWVRSIAFQADDSVLLTSADREVRLWDVSRFAQPMAELARAACADFLLDRERRFSAEEIGADPLIRDVWLRNGREERDVCEGVPGMGRSP